MQRWKTPSVRDLAWVISSPCVIEHTTIPHPDFFAHEYEQFLPKLERLDKDPQELLEFLQKTKRAALGKYFEDLIEFWLTRRANTKILARNLQIIEDKKTLGECDFIVALDGVVTHIEVAIKYYLGIRNSSAQEFWVGRGLTDRLDMKFNKLFKQQLGLSDSATMHRQLTALNIAPIAAKMAIVKGFFFKYYFAENHMLPERAPRNMEESFWCRVDEVDALPEEFTHWQILTKPHWLTYDEVYFDRSELQSKAQNYFDNVKSTPVLCNAFRADKLGEPIKFFIAPLHYCSYCP